MNSRPNQKAAASGSAFVHSEQNNTAFLATIWLITQINICKYDSITTGNISDKTCTANSRECGLGMFIYSALYIISKVIWSVFGW